MADCANIKAHGRAVFSVGRFLKNSRVTAPLCSEGGDTKTAAKTMGATVNGIHRRATVVLRPNVYICLLPICLSFKADVARVAAVSDLSKSNRCVAQITLDSGSGKKCGGSFKLLLFGLELAGVLPYTFFGFSKSSIRSGNEGSP